MQFRTAKEALRLIHTIDSVAPRPAPKPLNAMARIIRDAEIKRELAERRKKREELAFAPPPPEPPRPPVSLPPSAVVSNVPRAPANRQAAMMVAKPPWWAYPPEEAEAAEPPPQPKPQREPKKEKPMSSQQNNKHIPPEAPNGCVTNRGTYEGSPIIPGSPSDNGAFRVPGQKAFRASVTFDGLEEYMEAQLQVLASTARGFKAGGDGVADEVKGKMLELDNVFEAFVKQSHAHLLALRSIRLQVVSEVAGMTGPLKDIRQFFHGPDHKEEIARLREFVDLCERLAKLKSNGSLDAMTEAITKLA